jgi:hypothetical protein
MSTGERATEDRAAAIAALTATLNAGLAEDEALAKAATDGPWYPEDMQIWGYNRPYAGGGPGILVVRHTWPQESAHIIRHDPGRELRKVKAMRDLIAAILAEPHDWVAGDEFYSCSQAVDYAGLNHESREPGSACTDPDRAGQPCDCGRDARVERLLRIIAGVYEEGEQ